MVSYDDCTFLVCAGSFHRSLHYQHFIEALHTKGFHAKYPVLPKSTVSDVSADDTINPEFDVYPPNHGWPNGHRDVKLMRHEIEKLSDKGKKVILVGRSYEGSLATEAAGPELQLQMRASQGKLGGTAGWFYVSGYMLPRGQSIDSFLSPDGDATTPPPSVKLQVSFSR